MMMAVVVIWKDTTMKNRNNIEDYLLESYNKNLKDRKEETIFGNIPVYIIKDLPDHINLQAVLKRIEDLIPEYLTYGIDSIYVEHLKEFTNRSVNAVFKGGSIYVTNFQDNDADLFDDIVHEIAHSVEQLFKKQIYKDDVVKKEFLGKRKRLLDLLKQEGYTEYETAFFNVDYSQAFDEYLHQTVGYPLLQTLTQGLFLSPYSVTSLREYFAIGFEEYFIKDKSYLKKMSPQLYNKIELVAEL